MAHVGATVSGRVSEIKYRIGDTVRQGDVLLILNSTELGMIQSEFLQKRSEIEVTRVALEVAESEYQRATILVNGNGISQAEFLRIEGKYKISKSALLTAESTAQSLENNLHLLGMSQNRIDALIASGEVDPVYNILAPIDGEIIARHATIGEVVHPDNDALMTGADMSVMWMIASVPEKQMHLVKIGASARFRSDAIGGESIAGMVTYIAPALDERTRTGQVRIESKGENIRLRPGMFGHVPDLSER
jgi:cobalt-zinc-cadmium efflux system membrane fusion protein